jgi:meiotic recombination protein DMC1
MLKFKVDPDQACENIVYARAQNSEVGIGIRFYVADTDLRQMQTEQLESLCQNFATNEYRLLVIDSVMALFRTDYIGRGELSERQQVLGGFLRKATQMAEEFNLVILMVCSCSSSFGRTPTDYRRPIKLCQTLVPVRCSRESMVANQLEDMFLPTLPPQDFSSARVVVRNVLLRLLIPPVAPPTYQ